MLDIGVYAWRDMKQKAINAGNGRVVTLQQLNSSTITRSKKEILKDVLELYGFKDVVVEGGNDATGILFQYNSKVEYGFSVVLQGTKVTAKANCFSGIVYFKTSSGVSQYQSVQIKDGVFSLNSFGTNSQYDFGYVVEATEESSLFLDHGFPKLDRVDFAIQSNSNSTESIKDGQIISYRYRINDGRMVGSVERTETHLADCGYGFTDRLISIFPLYFKMQPNKNKTILYSNWANLEKASNNTIRLTSSGDLYINNSLVRKFYKKDDYIETPIYIFRQVLETTITNPSSEGDASNISIFNDKDLTDEQNYKEAFLVPYNGVSSDFSAGDCSITWFGPDKEWTPSISTTSDIEVYDITNILLNNLDVDMAINNRNFIHSNTQVNKTLANMLINLFCKKHSITESVDLTTTTDLSNTTLSSNYTGYAGSPSNLKETYNNSIYGENSFVIKKFPGMSGEYKLDSFGVNFIAGRKWGTLTATLQYFTFWDEQQPSTIISKNNDFIESWLLYDRDTSGVIHVERFGPDKFGQLTTGSSGYSFYRNYVSYFARFSSPYFSGHIMPKNAVFGSYFNDDYGLTGAYYHVSNADNDHGGGLWLWGTSIEKTNGNELLSVIML